MAVISVGLIGSVLGAVYQNPGAADLVRPYVLWPILFAVALPGLVGLRTNTSLLRFLDFATIGVSILTLALAHRLVDASAFDSQIFGVVAAGQYETFTQVTFPATLSLLFLAPYSALRVMDRRGEGGRVVKWLSAALALLAGLSAGQRSIFLSYAVGLVAVVLLRYAVRSREGRRRVVGYDRRALWWIGASGLAMAAVVTGSFGRLGTAAGDLWAASLDSDEIRRDQAAGLIRDWSSSPIFGNGWGATVDGIVRNPEAPWQFELLYHSILNSVGVAGFALYLVAVVWLARTLARSAATGVLGSSAILAGLVGALVASSVNPLIPKLGTIWMLFVPVLFASTRHTRAPSVVNSAETAETSTDLRV